MFEQPFVRNCPLQKIDPRVRLSACVLYCIAISTCQTLKTALAGLLLGLFWLLFAMIGPKPPIQSLAKRFLAVNLFMGFIWLTTPFMREGIPFFSIGPLTFTKEGIFLAFLVTLKSNAMTCVFIAFLATLSIPSLTLGLRFFSCPTKLILLIIMGLRNIYVLEEEWQRLYTAARLRGFIPKASLHTWKTLASLWGILLLRSLDRASRVREAMLLRSFQGVFVMSESRSIQIVDVFFALISFSLIGILCLWEVGFL